MSLPEVKLFSKKLSAFSIGLCALATFYASNYLTIYATIYATFYTSKSMATSYSSEQQNKDNLQQQTQVQLGFIRTQHDEYIYNETVKFEQKESTLGSEQKEQLKAFADQVKLTGQKIIDINIAVWSDKELPLRSKVKLTQLEQDLAAHRAYYIKTYLERIYQLAPVDTFNMADQGQWLSRALSASESELKSKFAKNFSSEVLTLEEFDIISAKGGPNKAVITVKTVLQRSEE